MRLFGKKPPVLKTFAVEASLAKRGASDSAIADARQSYEKEKSDRTRFIHVIPEILANLQLAGVGLEVLDPKGERSAADFQREFDEVYLEYARSLYRLNVKNPRDCVNVVPVINENLAKVGAGLEALDPEGKKTAAEFQREFDEAYLEYARSLYEDNPGNRTRDNAQVATIVRLLKDVGVGMERLDRTGKKTAQEISAELANVGAADWGTRIENQFNANQIKM